MPRVCTLRTGECAQSCVNLSFRAWLVVAGNDEAFSHAQRFMTFCIVSWRILSREGTPTFFCALSMRRPDRKQELHAAISISCWVDAANAAENAVRTCCPFGVT